MMTEDRRGEGIAFAGFCMAAAYMTVAGQDPVGIWLLVVIWWLFRWL